LTSLTLLLFFFINLQNDSSDTVTSEKGCECRTPNFTSMRYFVLFYARAKLRKPTVNFVLSVCLSVRHHGTARLPLDGFSLNLILRVFLRKCDEKIQISFKLLKTKRSCFLYKDCAYRAVNSLHVGYKNKYSGPLTYELNSFPRAGRNSSWS
jgi:hypothetical protein